MKDLGGVIEHAQVTYTKDELTELRDRIAKMVQELQMKGNHHPIIVLNRTDGQALLYWMTDVGGKGWPASSVKLMKYEAFCDAFGNVTTDCRQTPDIKEKCLWGYHVILSDSIAKGHICIL